MISTELGTGTSWVNTNETGFVIAPRDADVLAEKMNYLFDNSEQSRILGAHAQKRANELFSANSCGGAYLEIYHCRRKIGTMNKIKPYKEQYSIMKKATEPMVTYTNNRKSSNVIADARDDIRCVIFSEEF